jgi:hypothetical protein
MTSRLLTVRGQGLLECLHRAALDTRSAEELRTEVLRGDTSRVPEPAHWASGSEGSRSHCRDTREGEE